MRSPLRPPTPGHDLLVRATLAPDPAAQDAYRRWRERVDLDVLDPPSVRLLPQLAQRLGDIDGDELAAQVSKIVRFTWLRTQTMIHAALAPLRMLAERGVPALLVKGAAVIHHTGISVAVRPMDDLDICVPVTALSEAAAVLEECGFHCQLSVQLIGDPDAVAPVLPSVTFIGGHSVELDLHWHLMHEHRHPRSSQDFWDAAVPSQLRDVPCQVTSREDTLVHVIEHGATWHETPALQWTADAALLLRGNAALDWDRVVWQASRQHLGRLLADGLSYLRELEAIEVPEPVLARLRALPRSRTDAALRQAERLPRAPGVLARERRRDLEEQLPPGVAVRPREVLRAGRRSRATLRAPLPADLPPVALDEPVSALLRPDGRGAPHLLAGWYYAEDHGTWSRDRRVRIALPLAEATGAELELEAEMTAFITAAHPRLAVDVLLGRRRLATWTFEGDELLTERRTARVPGRPGRRLLDLQLRLRDPIDGMRAGFNGDPRPMGVALRSVVVQEA